MSLVTPVMQILLEFRKISPWLAAIAIILLVTSELISPRHGKTNILINQKRLKNAALTMGLLFLITVAIQIYEVVMVI